MKPLFNGIFSKKQSSEEDGTHPLASPIPQKIGKYELKKQIGFGAVGLVYLAIDTHLQRPVAIKILRPEKNTKLNRKRFLREARAMANLEHPHILTIYEISSHSELCFFAMKYIKGEDLGVHLQKRSLSQEQMLEILKKVCDAIAYAHSRKFIHRDIKPANILLDQELNPYIMDFGLAKVIGNDAKLNQLTQDEGLIMGSPFYMSPEQANGENRKVGAASDVYALGVILYEIITGTLPFPGPSPLLFFAQLAEFSLVSPREKKASIPPALEDLCLKAMDRNGKLRPSSQEMARQLSCMVGIAPPIVVAPTEERKLPQPKSKRQVAAKKTDKYSQKSVQQNKKPNKLEQLRQTIREKKLQPKKKIYTFWGKVSKDTKNKWVIKKTPKAPKSVERTAQVVWTTIANRAIHIVDKGKKVANRDVLIQQHCMQSLPQVLDDRNIKDPISGRMLKSLYKITPEVKEYLLWWIAKLALEDHNLHKMYVEFLKGINSKATRSAWAKKYNPLAKKILKDISE